MGVAAQVEHEGKRGHREPAEEQKFLSHDPDLRNIDSRRELPADRLEYRGREYEEVGEDRAPDGPRLSQMLTLETLNQEETTGVVLHHQAVTGQSRPWSMKSDCILMLLSRQESHSGNTEMMSFCRCRLHICEPHVTVLMWLSLFLTYRAFS
jgi:hypothetical protein